MTPHHAILAHTCPPSTHRRQCGLRGHKGCKPRHGWLERLLEPSNLLVFTILLWSFVFMMMIVVFLRVERHLRAMAAEGKLLAQRKP